MRPFGRCLVIRVSSRFRTIIITVSCWRVGCAEPSRTTSSAARPRPSCASSKGREVITFGRRRTCCSRWWSRRLTSRRSSSSGPPWITPPASMTRPYPFCAARTYDELLRFGRLGRRVSRFGPRNDCLAAEVAKLVQPARPRWAPRCSCGAHRRGVTYDSAGTSGAAYSS